MQRLGQHFLKNPAVLRKIVSTLRPAAGETVIEIGAGHGELTIPLLAEVSAAGGRVISIEKDAAFIEPLTAIGRENAGGCLSIIEGDVLKCLPDIVAGLQGNPYKIAGNIPYYITGKLLRTIGELDHKPLNVVLLIQEEVARRISDAPPDMNRLAASVQFWAEPKIVARVPRTDFSPAPEVDSAIILLDIEKNTSRTVAPAEYYRTVRAIFAQPRKMLINNLASAVSPNIKKQDISAHLLKIGVDPASRPQDLTIEHVISISKAPLWG